MKSGLIKKGGSGLYLNAHDKEAFEHFLQNSTSAFFRSGSNGMTYTLTLNPGVESKYLSLDASTYSLPVRQLLVKTVFIYPLPVQLDIVSPSGSPETKNTTTIDNFYEEVNIQTDVYLKTMQYLEPLCPAIVYAGVVYNYTDPLMQYVSNMISQNLSRETQKKLREYPGLGIGLIGMEVLDQANSLHDFMNKKDFYEGYIAKAYHTLIEFMIQTGYSHGDFHSGNFLVDSNIRNYFWGKKGKVTIIDFGYSQKLTKDKYNEIKTLYKQQTYVDILLLLCDIPRKDFYDMNDFQGYTVMCLKSQPKISGIPGYSVDKREINNKIIELYALREQSINNLVKTFTAKKLPLSNSAKNEMYNGVYFQKKTITTFENAYNVTNMSTQVNKIFDDIIGLGLYFDNSQRIRAQVKACYMILYLLNNKFNDNLAIRFSVMVYAGVFHDIDATYVFRIAAPYVHVNAFKLAIDRCMILENVRFNNFLDYFSDDQLANITQEQLTQILNTALWQERPESAAIALKIAANIPTSIHKPIKPLDIKKGFEILPFEEIIMEEPNVSETNGVITNGPTDGLPRPSFLDPGLQKKKLTAGKVQKTKRRRSKRASRKKI